MTARLCKKRIQVSGDTTETDQVFVNPDGTSVVEQYRRPVRVKQDGKWTPVDATLVFAADGAVVAKAAAVELRLSGGNDAVLARTVQGEVGIELGSPLGALPRPSLAGNVATYADVLPGVDLVVVAKVDGFSQRLVVKRREAAADPALRALRFPMKVTGGSVGMQAGGALQVLDGKGSAVFAMSTAQMWDDTETKANDASARPAVGADGARLADLPTGRRVAMGVTYAGGVLAVTPDRALLEDPATAYPVTIDPGFTAYMYGWNYVDSSAPNHSYYNVADWAPVGTSNSGGFKRRSFWNMNLEPMGTGKQILSATFRIREVWAWSCTAREVELHRTAWVNSNVTWNTQPASNWWVGNLNVAKGWSPGGIGGASSCPAGDLSWDVTNAVQDNQNNGYTAITFMLRAQNETDNAYWKRFDPNPRLDITYNSYPYPPSISTSPTTPCVYGAGRPYINTATPRLNAATGDDEGSQLTTTFEWYHSGGTIVGSGSASTPAGTVASVTVPAGQLSEGGSYGFRARSYDGIGYGPWTGFCEFTVDTIKPGVPLVSSTLYPSTSMDNTWGHGGAGQDGQFTFTPPSGTTDVAAWVYQLDTQTAATTLTATGASTVTVTPTEEGRRTLTVRAKDRAGNLSDPNTYVFNVGRAGLRLPAPGATAVARMKLAIDGDSTYTRATFQYRRGPGGAEYDVPLVHLRKADGSAVAAYPVTLSDLGGNAIWNAVDTLGATGGVVQVRAVLYTSTDATNGYNTQWVTATVDPDGDGAAATTVGPASVNLLTGDASQSSTDADEFGLSVDRTASSRKPSDGWLPQGERLSSNQQQILADPNRYSGVWYNTRFGDYSGDGKADLVKMEGGYLYGYTSYGSSWNDPFQVGSGWSQAQWDNTRLGDYSGDGKADLVQMEGGTLYGYTSNGAGWNNAVVVGSGWSQAQWDNTRLGDYSGDGKADLVQMEGGTLYGYTSNGAGWNNAVVVGSGWSQAQWDNTRLGDYSGDGKADLVQMEGGTLYGYTSYGSGWNNAVVVGSGWSQAQWDNTKLGDYSGDGKADLVQMEGGNLYGYTSYGTSWNNAVQVGSGWSPPGDGVPFVTNTALLARSTTRGQGSSTDSLAVTPAATTPPGAAAGDTFAAVGADQGALRLNMKPAHRYRLTGWIYVPAATGLNPVHSRGLRIVGFYKDSGGVYREVSSVKAGWVDAWQELTVDLDIPAGATEAFFRLYNGFEFGTGKIVYWDNLSLREVIAPFGPQWRGGTGGGVADVDYTALRFPSAELAEISTTTGSPLTFARSLSGQFYPEPGAEDLTLTAVDSLTYRLSDLDGTVTEFTKQGDGFVVTATWTPEQNSSTRYLYDTTDNRSLPKRIINAVQPGLGDCTTTIPARGCEVLEYDYATATTATTTTFGNVIDRVRAIKIWSWDPTANGGTGAETAVEVANYAYDDQGRLREVWDPRLSPPLKTTYEYDSAGRVTKVGTAGQLPWMFDYGTIAGDTNAGRLLKVRRAALVAGSKDQLDGEVATTVVYGVPLTKAAGGPHDLNAAAISTWGQKDLPTDATAVFGPESVPTVNVATQSAPGTGGYGLANITYLNASGQAINTAAPGNYIDSQSYDEYGNVIWSLEATNRDLALGLLPDAATRVAELNLPADTAQRAALLATTNRYSPDGLDLLETTGPVVKVALERQLVDPTGALPTLAPGTQVIARGHATHLYDEGKPDGATYHLETTERSGGAVAGYPDADVRVVHTGYDPQPGTTSGWVLKKDTSTTTDAGTAYTVYDSAGRVLKSWGIGSNGADARATETIYYTAGTNSTDAACGNRPEWAGSPCVTRAAGAVTGHDPARATTTLPVKRVEEYSRFGDPSKVSETSNGKTRRTTTTYNGADRVTSVVITSDDGSIAQDPVLTEYDAATGNPWKTTVGTSVITREYDQLGRVVTYTDADGGTTQSQFDRFGKATRVSDNTGWTTYTYDRNMEPRGMVTSVTDSVAGTFNAKYSPDGQLTEVKYPGGITRTDTLDANFAPVGRVYKRDSDGTVIYAESIVENTAGQWINHTYTGGSKTYGYDTLGRLTSTQQLSISACATRTYAYDSRTNRTSKKTFSGCQTDTADTEEGHTYDTADRIMDAGYVHDAFGRITTTPGGLTNTYYTNDLVAQQVLDDTKQNWTLDPAHRFRSYTTSKLVGGTWTNASSKLNHYGDDSDEPRWIVEDTSLGSITRNVSGPDADLIATTSATGDVRLQLTNLHGDVAMSIDTALTTPEAYSYDEFGMAQDSSSDRRYGWLGGKQRSGEALGGIILMGVRLYSPSLGRFLQVDPVPGGNSNAYDYCSGDAVNCSDLDGKFGWGSIKKALNKVAVVASYASMIPGPIGTIAGVVSAVAYVATGNWKEAAWAVAGAAAAVVGAGAAVKGARLAVGAVRAARSAKSSTFAFKTARSCKLHSFDPATLVLMADGSRKPIGEVTIGDMVSTTDPETGETVARMVTAFHDNVDTDLTDVTLRNGGADAVVHTTRHHPFWSLTRQDWVDAEDLVAGEFLSTAGGGSKEVVQVYSFGGAKHMNDLTVDELHTYYVAADASAEPVLVHNCGGMIRGAIKRWKDSGNINLQKQAGHLRGTPQYINRLKVGKSTSEWRGGEKFARVHSRLAYTFGRATGGCGWRTHLATSVSGWINQWPGAKQGSRHDG
ncbi:DNRLRE domain-containing protein [Dactylosporangium sp. NPDC000555]|uniref:DNRLRE domain-containing protein n=1 Tax=Dactylosporangium sp. NPDC000555 TaxID=3154260 RepID=UPI0033247DB7